MTKGEHGVAYGFRKHLIPFAAGSANASNPLRRLDEHAWATSTLYTDFPFYALSCALAAAYPRALFVDVRRDCDAWAQSALSQLFCVWLRAGCMRAETFCAKRATNVPKTHIAVGFCTTKWCVARRRRSPRAPRAGTSTSSSPASSETTSARGARRSAASARRQTWL